MTERVFRAGLRSLVLAGVALGALTFSVHAQDAAKPATGDDPVVARVNSQEIRRSEVMRTIASLPPQVQQMPPQMLFPAIIDQMINGKLVSSAGYAQKLDQEKDVKDRVKKAEERIVQEAYLTRAVQARITDAKLQEAYQTFLKENPAKEEVKAAHILVENEDQAKQIVADLKKGADFAKLAQEKSTDKAAAAQGGDLGYFTKDDMVEPFSEAAFKLKPGEITEAPVKTQFGWHVIKVEDRREGKPPAFEEVKDQLQSEMSQEIIGEVVDELRATAKVERFQPDGSPLPAEAAPAAPTDAAKPAEAPKKK
ncbi:MAG TPA: peptidylprolyl isomerase [Azospirillaceae bacterium]|nr:peptidylprolyl isomerase [Azospirillaceae bacterium]